MKRFDAGGGRLLLSAVTFLAAVLAGSRAGHLPAQQPRVLRGHKEWSVVSLAFSPDGKTLASGGSWPGATVRLWDLQSGETRTQIVPYDSLPWAKQDMSNGKGAIECLTFSPDGKTLAVLLESWGNQLFLYDPVTAKQKLHTEVVVPFERQPRPGFGRPFTAGAVGGGRSGGGPCHCLAFSPDGKLVASGTNSFGGPILKVWDARGRLRWSGRGHAGGLACMSFLPSSPGSAEQSAAGSLISADYAANLQLWSATGGKMGQWNIKDHFKQAPEGRKDSPTYELPISCMAVFPDGKTLAVGGKEGTICLWDLEKQQMKRTLNTRRGRVLSLAIAPDGKMLAWVGTSDVLLRDLEEDKQIVMFKPPVVRKTLPSGDSYKSVEGPARCVAFSPDGKTLASGHWDKSIRLWDLGQVEWKSPGSHR